jgi:hypothetical protein
VNFRSGAVHISSDGSFALLSPALDGGGESTPVPTQSSLSQWEDFPFVLIEFDATPASGSGVLLWKAGDDPNQALTRAFDVSAGSTRVILDVRTPEFWNDIGAWEGPISQFGLRFERSAAIRSVSLKASLSVAERVEVLRDSLSRPELFRPSTINFLYGISLFGRPLILYLGVALVVVGLLALLFARSRSFPLLISIGLACFVALDLQFLATLGHHVRSSSERSAWHADPHAEDSSRHGADFADLVRKFEEIVPRGSPVFFPREKRWWTKGETNWMAFRLHPHYPSVDLADAEYIFYYRPNDWVYDSKGALHSPALGVSVPIVEVHRISSRARIFRPAND